MDRGNERPGPYGRGRPRSGSAAYHRRRELIRRRFQERMARLRVREEPRPAWPGSHDESCPFCGSGLPLMACPCIPPSGLRPMEGRSVPEPPPEPQSISVPEDPPQELATSVPNLWVESAAVSLRLENSSQISFLNVLPELLSDNAMLDFDENGEFARTNAMFFGCSLTIRANYTGSVGCGPKISYSFIGHFVCVFASQVVKNGVTGPPASKCPHYTQPVMELCSSEHTYPSVFMCDIESHICPESRNVEDWQYTLDGTLSEIVFFTSKQIGIFPALNTTRITSQAGLAVSESTMKANVWAHGLPIDLYNYAPWPPYFSQYSADQLNRLDSDNLTEYISIHMREHSYIQLQQQRECPPDKCCFWTFIISAVLLIIVTATFILIMKRRLLHKKHV